MKHDMPKMGDEHKGHDMGDMHAGHNMNAMMTTLTGGPFKSMTAIGSGTRVTIRKWRHGKLEVEAGARRQETTAPVAARDPQSAPR